MLLYFTSLDNESKFRECSWWFTTVEAAFDALSTVSAKGNHILSAELIENNQRTVLPVDAFDGNHFSTPIKELESEWQQILSQPVDHQPVYVAYNPAKK